MSPSWPSLGANSAGDASADRTRCWTATGRRATPLWSPARRGGRDRERSVTGVGVGRQRGVAGGQGGVAVAPVYLTASVAVDERLSVYVVPSTASVSPVTERSEARSPLRRVPAWMVVLPVKASSLTASVPTPSLTRFPPPESRW